ncbi:MAG: HAMP domain-containing histidine kinase [Candidatus Omnitrophica bacterium]|nr:HAMP domain-containing histidine kinase [Candidatus Omnitrophota bacterium]
MKDKPKINREQVASFAEKITEITGIVFDSPSYAVLKDAVEERMFLESIHSPEEYLADITEDPSERKTLIGFFYSALKEGYLAKIDEEMKKLDQMKSDFISTVSHELRTPLSIAKEGVCLVLDKIAGDINVKQEELLNLANVNIDRLSKLINDLLSISDIETGKTKLEKGKVNIVTLLKNTCLYFKEKITDKGIKLCASLPGSAIELCVDEEKLTQAFRHLLENALKFTTEGKIEVVLEEKDKEVECVISDTGQGIKEEDIKEIFRKFQQFGRTPGAGEKGTGIGLCIAKELIELHGGTLILESRHGKGTKITVIIPK